MPLAHRIVEETSHAPQSSSCRMPIADDNALSRPLHLQVQGLLGEAGAAEFLSTIEAASQEVATEEKTVEEKRPLLQVIVVPVRRGSLGLLVPRISLGDAHSCVYRHFKSPDTKTSWFIEEHDFFY